MQTLGERISTTELLPIAARTTTVGTYGSAVIDRVEKDSSRVILHSAASSAGTGVSLAVKMQESDAAGAGSFDNRSGTEVAVELRKGSNDNIKLAAKVTQSGARQVKSVFLRLKNVGTIASGKTVTVTLETDSSGDPSGTAIHADATATVLCSSIDSSFDWVEFELTRPVDIADTTVFHIVLSGNYTESSSNYIAWATETVGSGGDFNIFDSAWGGVSSTTAAMGYIEEYNFSDISGAAFTAVDETAGSFQELDVELSERKRYLRALATVTGTSASFQCGAHIILGNAAERHVSG